MDGPTPADHHRRRARADLPGTRRAAQGAALRVAVQDGRRLVREGVAALLAAEPSVHSVTCVEALDELADGVAREEFDVVVFSAAQARPVAWSASSLRLHRFTDAMSASDLVAGVGGYLDPDGPAPEQPPPIGAGTGVLTRREAQILGQIANGMSSHEVGAALGISARTVQNHKQRIFAKLGVQSQAHAVAVALAASQLPAPDLGPCAR